MTEADVDRAHRPGARRTLLALLASALGVVPLKALLADSRWLGETWLAMAIVIVPAALLRTRRAPSALDIWPGVILLIPWLTRVYVPDHAWHGFIPTGATFGDISDLMTNLHRITSNEVAPIHSTVAVRLVISALLGLLAALIDLIAVVGRRGALAGVPLLILYTVSGAVPREPVDWFWFAIAAVGYLILLALDAPDELLDWGRRVSRPGAARSTPGLAFSAQRIGVIAILVAIALPFLVPAHAKNLIADAFHSGGGSGIGSIGANSSGTEISPFVELKGQLERDKPVPLMTVSVEPGAGVQPFYARTNVLDTFTGHGWRVGEHGLTEPVEATAFSSQPVTERPQSVGYRATITITGLSGNPPVFTAPVRTEGLDARTTWSPQDQLLLGSDVQIGQRFVEDVQQPQPTIQQLQAAGSTSEPDMSRWLDLPAMPTFVSDLVTRLTAGADTSYAKARAIFQYFAEPANHFVYTLRTAKGDSGSDLVDFLQHRRGFCQQYAAAMGVMLRLAGVPSRIVLGYMHPPPDRSGNFSIDTFDAHAWVEAFLPGAGWIPFDPTPTAGLIGGKQTDLPWAPHSYASDVGLQGPSISSSPTARPSKQRSSGAPADAQHGRGSGAAGNASLIIIGLLVIVLAAAALIPNLVRSWRRRSRLAAARRGDTDALWAELSDTAVDLGYVWSPARSPRQVSAWLAHDAADTAPALDALATAVEHGRYARAASPADARQLTEGLLDVRDQLWSRRSRGARLQARLWPASLGWGSRVAAVREVLRRRH